MSWLLRHEGIKEPFEEPEVESAPSFSGPSLNFLPDTVELNESERLHVAAAMSRGVKEGIVVEYFTHTFAYQGERPTPEDIYRALRKAQTERDTGNLAPEGTPITDREVFVSPADIARKRKGKGK